VFHVSTTFGISKSLFVMVKHLPRYISRLKKRPIKSRMFGGQKKQCCFILLLYWSTQNLNPKPQFDWFSKIQSCMQFPIHDGELPILWFRSPQLAVKSFILRSDSSRNHIMFIQMYMYIHTYVGTSILVYIYIYIYHTTICMDGWPTKPSSRLLG
jgi:hypothetical protein